MTVLPPTEMASLTALIPWGLANLRMGWTFPRKVGTDFPELRGAFRKAYGEFPASSYNRPCRHVRSGMPEKLAVIGKLAATIFVLPNRLYKNLRQCDRIVLLEVACKIDIPGKDIGTCRARSRCPVPPIDEIRLSSIDPTGSTVSSDRQVRFSAWKPVETF